MNWWKISSYCFAIGMFWVFLFYFITGFNEPIILVEPIVPVRIFEIVWGISAIIYFTYYLISEFIKEQENSRGEK